MSMNKWIISLRDLKVAIIEEIQCLVQEVKTIQSSLNSSQHLPIPPVPQLQPNEVPEKKFQYDNEMLLKFKQDEDARAKQKEAAIPDATSTDSAALGGFGGGFLHNPSAKELDLVGRATSIKSMKMASVTVSAVPKAFEIEQVEPTEMELEIAKREEIKNVYLQEHLIKRVRE